MSNIEIIGVLIIICVSIVVNAAYINLVRQYNKLVKLSKESEERHKTMDDVIMYAIYPYLLNKYVEDGHYEKAADLKNRFDKLDKTVIK